MISVVSVYADKPGCWFDLDYFRDTHLPMVRRLLAGHGLLTLRVLKGKASLEGAEPPYRMISELTFTSMEDFVAAMAEHGAALAADTANYTDLDPANQFVELLAE